MEVSEATTPVQPSVVQGSMDHLGVQGIAEAMEQGPAQLAPAEVAVAAPISPAAGTTCLLATATFDEPVSPQTATEAAAPDDQQDSSSVRCEKALKSANCWTCHVAQPDQQLQL